MADPIASLGRLLQPGEGERDAIHVAIMPVEAVEHITPGQTIGLVYGSAYKVKGRTHGEGIADPFLSCAQIQPGERFWMFLFPNTITGMRHHWKHPTIDRMDHPKPDTNPKPQKQESIKWLKSFAEKWHFDYHDMLDSALEEGGIIVARGIDLHDRKELDPGDEELFWRHIEVVTGKALGQRHRDECIWSCAC